MFIPLISQLANVSPFFSPHPQSLCYTTPNRSFTSSSPSLRPLLLTAPFSPKTFSNFPSPPLAPTLPASLTSTPFSSSAGTSLSSSSHLPSVSRAGQNLFDVWKFLPSKLQWTLLCEDRGETMLPGASYALYGDCVIGFGGALPRISLFFLHRSLWKTISLVSPREPPHRQEGSASLFPHAIAVETLDSHSTLFTFGGSTFPPSVPATAFLRTVSCDTSQLARCQRVPAGLFPRFPFLNVASRTVRRRSRRCRRTARRCARRRSNPRGARTCRRCSTRWGSARWICRGICWKCWTSPRSPSPTRKAGSRPCSIIGISRPRESL